jgi:hypothetical protein
MATVYWTGTATAVAQVDTVQITAVDGTPADNTFTLTVGAGNNTHAVSVVGDTDVNTTAEALKDAWNAETHPYCTGITATQATDTVTLTADEAGLPNTVVSSVTGVGSGTIGAVTSSTTCAGPHVVSTVANYSGGALPSASDLLIIADTDASLLWDLDALTNQLANVDIRKTFTGRIGLDYMVFHTADDGLSTDPAKPEYRPTALDLDLAAGSYVYIGRHDGPGTPPGSGRIIIDMQTSGHVEVHSTASSPADASREAVQLKGTIGTLFARSATGGIGLATDKPGSTITATQIYVLDTTSATRVVTQTGASISGWTQFGGNNVIDTTNNIAGVINEGGTLRTEGDFAITSFANGSELSSGGTSYLNHVVSSGAEVTTLTINGGLVDTTQTFAQRTFTTVNPNGGVLKGDVNSLTITTLNKPEKAFTMTVGP